MSRRGQKNFSKLKADNRVLSLSLDAPKWMLAEIWFHSFISFLSWAIVDGGHLSSITPCYLALSLTLSALIIWTAYNFELLLRMLLDSPSKMENQDLKLWMFFTQMLILAKISTFTTVFEIFGRWLQAYTFAPISNEFLKFWYCCSYAFYDFPRLFDSTLDAVLLEQWRLKMIKECLQIHMHFYFFAVEIYKRVFNGTVQIIWEILIT